MWLIRSQPVSLRGQMVGLGLAVLLPILAAAVQSVWIVYVRGTHIYQAMLNRDDFFLFVDLWGLFVIQELVAVSAVWPLSRLPNLQRLLALVAFVGFLYYDCCVVTRAVRR